MCCLRLLISTTVVLLLLATGAAGCSDDDDDGASADTNPVAACTAYKNAVIDKDWECYSSSGFYDDVGEWCAVTRGCADGQFVPQGLVDECVSAIEGATCTEYASQNYDSAACDILWDELDCQPV